MKTDSLFYKLFQQSPQLLLELAGLELACNEAYRFRSEEIKQTAFRIDGVLTPPPDNKALPLVFTEVQFQSDPKFYSRFFCEIFFYLHQNQPTHPWHAVVVYPSRNVETAGEKHYSALLASTQVQRIYLDELKLNPDRHTRLHLVQLIIEDTEQVPKVARRLIKAIENGEWAVDNKARILEIIETILVYKFPNLSREEVQSMLGYNDISLKDTRFYRDVYDEGRQEGRQEGHQEGFHEGRQGECIELVQRLLIRRLGNDPEIVRSVATMQTMALEQLEELAEALLEFTTAADLDAWLRKHGVC
ncbi:MAG: Rpn family recombination-promoting nuclease/putative transposase [Gammaproteobacteria bacterium]